MKKVFGLIMILGAVSLPAFANADKDAGRCGAMAYILGKHAEANLAMRHAENKGRMQVYANEFLEKVKTDPKKAAELGNYACMNLRIKV